MGEPERKPSLITQFRAVLSNDALPVSVRVLFGMAFSLGLIWSLSIAASNFFSW